MTTDVRDVQQGQVWKGGRLAATLTRTPAGVEFAYFADYDGPPVASTLPLSDVPVRVGGGAVPSFFAGLFPEGHRLGALRRQVKTSADDELSLLLLVGADTIGDVQVLPPGVSPYALAPRLVIDPDAPIRYADLLRDLDINPDRTALPGVQDKASAAVINLPVSRAGERYLLKLDPPEYPGLVANEEFFLRAATACGLQAAQAQLVPDRDEVLGLLVLRFDRITTDGQPLSLAVEDGCQVLNRPPADKYLVGYAAAFRALSDLCDARLLAARTLLGQLAFAYLTGNGDAHAKNFSVLQQPDGEWRVSPAYDVPSSQPYGDTTTAMPVNARRADVGVKDFLALGADLGIPPRAVIRVLRDLTDRIDLWLPNLGELPYDRDRITKLRRVVEQRRRRLSPPAG